MTHVVLSHLHFDHFGAPGDRFADDFGQGLDQAYDSALEPCAAVQPLRLTISFRRPRAMV